MDLNSCCLWVWMDTDTTGFSIRFYLWDDREISGLGENRFLFVYDLVLVSAKNMLP